MSATTYHIEKLAKDLRVVRHALGKSIRDVADELGGISNSTIHRIENAKSVDFETGKCIESWIRCSDVRRVFLHVGAFGHIARDEDIPGTLVCSIEEASQVEGCQEWIELVEVRLGTWSAGAAGKAE